MRASLTGVIEPAWAPSPSIEESLPLLRPGVGDNGNEGLQRQEKLSPSVCSELGQVFSLLPAVSQGKYGNGDSRLHIDSLEVTHGY